MGSEPHELKGSRITASCVGQVLDGLADAAFSAVQAVLFAVRLWAAVVALLASQAAWASWDQQPNHFHVTGTNGGKRAHVKADVFVQGNELALFGVDVLPTGGRKTRYFGGRDPARTGQQRHVFNVSWPAAWS